MKGIAVSVQLLGITSVNRLSKTGFSLLVTAALTGTLSPAFADAQSNAIQSISATPDGSGTLLRVQMKEPPSALPMSFSVVKPPRVAIDFPATFNSTKQSMFDFAQGDVRSVNLVKVGDRIRMVMNLRRPVRYQATIEGDAVLVALQPSSSVAPADSLAAQDAVAAIMTDKVATPGAEASVLRGVDFRRGKDGEGRIVVGLPNPGVGVDVRQQGRSIVVDFLKATAPESLRRRLDVGDFGTPVRSVRTTQNGEHARIVIEPSGLWEHNAYQTDSQFIVEVKALREDPTRIHPGNRPGYRGEKLSLNFQNVDVRALLQVIADFTNLNIVVRDTVSGNLTLRLKDVPWDQALDIVLQSRHLDMRRNGNVILIAPREELATQEKLALEAKQQISEIEPMQVEVFQLNYQKAESVQKLLSDEKQAVLSKSGSAVSDARTNKLFVRDTASRIEEVRRMIAQLDVAVRQVLIEARIVEADDRFSRNLGVKFGMNDVRSTITRAVSQIDPVTGVASTVQVPVYGAGSQLLRSNTFATLSGRQSAAARLSSQIDGAGTGVGTATALADLDTTNFVNLPAGGISGMNPASFAVSLFGSSLTRFVNLEISALEAEQRGKVVSSPRVLTADQGKATIEQGTELPYQMSTASGATAVSFRKANLKLDVVPQITPEGNVIMKVQVNRDAVGQLTTAGFAIDTRAVNTEVVVENGGTVVIGGIYEQFERNRVNKVPVLGDIPYLGALFRNTARTNDRTELLVFLTPRVVTAGALPR